MAVLTTLLSCLARAKGKGPPGELSLAGLQPSNLDRPTESQTLGKEVRGTGTHPGSAPGWLCVLEKPLAFSEPQFSEVITSYNYCRLYIGQFS